MHPLAKAMREWQNTAEGKKIQEGPADGVYLKNRLELAFKEGWRAAESVVKGALNGD